MILAGMTLSFVQESRNTYDSRNFGTIRAPPLSLLEHSLEYKSKMAFQPKVVPLSLQKLFVPPLCDEKSALIIFLSCKVVHIGQTCTYLHCNYLVAGTNKPVDVMWRIEWVNKPGLHSICVSIAFNTIHTRMPMYGFQGRQIWGSSITNQQTCLQPMNL